MRKFRLQFGGKITPEDQAKYEASDNWKDGSFKNLEETEMDVPLRKIPGIIYKQMIKKSHEPKAKLPIAPLNKTTFLEASDKVKFIWYGHSVILMRMANKTILIDPMLGPDTSPIAPFATKRYSDHSLDVIEDFPEIDLMVLTHDHYDHLDYDSIQKLKLKTKQYYVALGIKRHLVKWGVDASLIREFDWWEDAIFGTIKITFTPTRHFSGRGIKDRSKCLWGGWVFKTETENIWFSGDGGYGKHFKTIGEKLGPFDFAFMECGQYNEDWRPIHLFPEETIQAALDAQVNKAMPVHWCGFTLSYQHGWMDPANDFVKFSKEKGLDYLMPKIGQLFTSTDVLQEAWWLDL